MNANWVHDWFHVKNEWQNTFLPFQECSDPNVLGNLLAIFRELLAARTEWRPSALHHILSLEATDVISRLLVRVCKPGTGSPTLSDHSFICCFWILSALATKGKQTAAKKWENKSWYYKISVANWQLAKVWIHWKWFHVKSHSRQKTRVKQGYFLANHKNISSITTLQKCCDGMFWCYYIERLS